MPTSRVRLDVGGYKEGNDQADGSQLDDIQNYNSTYKQNVQTNSASSINTVDTCSDYIL